MPTDGQVPAGIVAPWAASAAYTSISWAPGPIVTERLPLSRLIPAMRRMSTITPSWIVE